MRKGLECFSQHGGILLPVVAEPSFPKGECPNAIVRYGGLTVRDDVLDVLAWAYAKERV